MNRENYRILTKASTEFGENWSDIISLIGFTLIPLNNIKYFVRDNILDVQVNAQKYYIRDRGDIIFMLGEKVMVKRKIFQTKLSKDLISHKLESMNCGPFIITTIHGNNVTLNLVMDEASYEVKKMYLLKFKGYPEPEWIKEVDTDCEELVREYWNKVQKKQLNSRRERENATSLQNYQALQPITTRQQNSDNPNQRNQSKNRKSTNQNTSKDDDELDLRRKVIPKRL
ncbi:hypothetical protein ACTFIW_000997 [Dictyostelium discoideum]